MTVEDLIVLLGTQDPTAVVVDFDLEEISLVEADAAYHRIIISAI